MYKIILADESELIIDSLKFIINKKFKKSFLMEYAKTAASVIEISEIFLPDIVFIDVNMININGVNIIESVKKFSSFTIFIIMISSDKIKYGNIRFNDEVSEFIKKPINTDEAERLIKKSIEIIGNNKKRKHEDLRIKEKLDTVVPIIENGFINAAVFEDVNETDIIKYKELLDIKQEYACIIVLEFGEGVKEGKLTNPIGTGVRAHSLFPHIRQKMKQYYNCIIGPNIGNKVAAFIAVDNAVIEYGKRIELIEDGRELIHNLSKNVNIKFRIGIGSVRPIYSLRESYSEALNALKYGKSTVTYIDDLQLNKNFVGYYPIDIENQILENVERGNIKQAINNTQYFFNWMVKNYYEHDMSIKLKVLEVVMKAENKAFKQGGINYNFLDRKDYLEYVVNVKNYEELEYWFCEKISITCKNIIFTKEEHSSSAIYNAKAYMQKNFVRDISLDDVSKAINMNPYYFSKLFKEETGVNFIDYLTRIRIEHAKMLLKNDRLSIKEVCVNSGYSNPNYFSRIFKKYVGKTPTEFREGS